MPCDAENLTLVVLCWGLGPPSLVNTGLPQSPPPDCHGHQAEERTAASQKTFFSIFGMDTSRPDSKAFPNVSNCVWRIQTADRYDIFFSLPKNRCHKLVAMYQGWQYSKVWLTEAPGSITWLYWGKIKILTSSQLTLWFQIRGSVRLRSRFRPFWRQTS